jgi:hypothetical protein
MNHTVVLYDTKKILSKIEMTPNELREICVISGTDYNSNNQANLYTTMKYFKKYKKNLKTNECKTENVGFYNWLLEENSNYIEIYDIETYNKICSIFNLNDYLKEYENIKIVNSCVIRSNVKEILKKDGFIFAR